MGGLQGQGSCSAHQCSSLELGMSLPFQGAPALIRKSGMAIQDGSAVGPLLGHWKNGKGRAHSPFPEAFQMLK